MRIMLVALAISSGGLAAQAHAQCPAPAGAYYGGYAGYAPYGAYYAPYASYSPYAPYATYAPFRARQPSYPAFTEGVPAARYGTQTTYFRGQPGPFAPAGGTFFGGYDYQVTYPPDWYGGYWTWW
ncbi:MAG TPA: hypothetical protein VFI31_14230 [Pirellulales bacterium]|nr:hypothetical protein [Pirellulales bacterium]